MRIGYSDNYYHGYDCEVGRCERHYCTKHRELWRDCDTAQATHEGSGRPVWELGDCPDCEADSRLRRWTREKELVLDRMTAADREDQKHGA